MNFMYIETGAYELLLSEVNRLTAELAALKRKLTPSTDE